MSTAVEKWEWYGVAAHFICGESCRFHMATKVGNYLISTVGEYWPDRAVREIHAKVHDIEWLSENGTLRGDAFDAAYFERFGYETIGCDRTYETMVFKAGKRCTAKDCNCGLPEIDGSALDFSGYNDRNAAQEGHLKLCKKYARKSK